MVFLRVLYTVVSRRFVALQNPENNVFFFFCSNAFCHVVIILSILISHRDNENPGVVINTKSYYVVGMDTLGQKNSYIAQTILYSRTKLRKLLFSRECIL